MNQRYWRGPLVWNTANPTFLHWRAPHGAQALLDLRSLPECRASGGTPGVALFATPPDATLPSEYDLLGEGDWHEIRTDRKLRDAIPCRRGHIVEGDTLAELIRSAVCEGGDPTGQEFAKPLLPGPRFRAEVFLGGASAKWLVDPNGAHWNRCLDVIRSDIERAFNDAAAGKLHTRHSVGDRQHYRRFLDSVCVDYRTEDWRQFVPAALRLEIPGPLPHETVITDNFNRLNADALGSSSEGWSWTEVIGDIDISGNQAVGQTNPSRGRAESALSSANQYTKGTIVAASCGPCVRYASSADTCYVMYNDSSTRLFKCVSGTMTNLGSLTSFGSGVAMLQVSGSTLQAFDDGVSLGSISDGSITGNLYTGIECDSVFATYDNFEAGDLAVGHPARRRLGGCRHAAGMNPVGLQGVKVF